MASLVSVNSAVSSFMGKKLMSWCQRHRGCVTPDILRTLAVTNLSSVAGFNTIRCALFLVYGTVTYLYLRRYEDQQKVGRAIAAQHVDPADIPTTAKVVPPPAMVPGVSFNALAALKRKYQPDVAETSRSLSQISMPKSARGSPGDDDDDVMLAEPEPVDELYCVMKTSIVGVQYYEGTYFGT